MVYIISLVFLIIYIPSVTVHKHHSIKASLNYFKLDYVLLWYFCVIEHKIKHKNFKSI